MAPVAALRIDPRPVAQIVATMLQAFRRAGVPACLPASAPAAHENRNHPASPSSETGVHLPAPVHPQASASTPGEHPAPICAQGQSPAVGLATGADTHPGSGPGDLRHPDGQPTGLSAPGLGSVPAESRRRIRLGGLTLVAFGSGLASGGGLVQL